MPVTIAEREHFRRSIQKRIDEKIQGLYRTDPTYRQRKADEARAALIKELGLAKMIAQDAVLLRQWTELTEKFRRHRAEMKARVKGCTVDLCLDRYGWVPSTDEKADANHYLSECLNEHLEGKIKELMAKDPLGKQILSLLNEKNTILDSVWLATSPGALAQLYEKAMVAIGEPPARSKIEEKAIDQGKGNA